MNSAYIGVSCLCVCDMRHVRQSQRRCFTKKTPKFLPLKRYFNYTTYLSYFENILEWKQSYWLFSKWPVARYHVKL